MIAALVLAAGKSERMGRPKMALPWADATVLGAVLRVLASAGIQDIRVVTGAARDLVEAICVEAGVMPVFNEAYGQRDMLSSIQTGLKSLPAATGAALIVLGDQPQMQVDTVQRVVHVYGDTKAQLVVPSHNMRRGHPWLVDRQLWHELLGMAANETARDFLSRHDADITYVEFDSSSIHADVDTPNDYLSSRP